MGFVMMNIMMQTAGMMGEIVVGAMLTQISVPYVPVMVCCIQFSFLVYNNILLYYLGSGGLAGGQLTGKVNFSQMICHK